MKTNEIERFNTLEAAELVNVQGGRIDISIPYEKALKTICSFVDGFQGRNKVGHC